MTHYFFLNLMMKIIFGIHFKLFIQCQSSKEQNIFKEYKNKLNEKHKHFSNQSTIILHIEVKI